VGRAGAAVHRAANYVTEQTEAPQACYNGFLEPVEGGAAGHQYAQVMHRCLKPILHTTDHGCAQCGRTWPQLSKRREGSGGHAQDAGYDTPATVESASAAPHS